MAGESFFENLGRTIHGFVKNKEKTFSIKFIQDEDTFWQITNKTLINCFQTKTINKNGIINPIQGVYILQDNNNDEYVYGGMCQNLLKRLWDHKRSAWSQYKNDPEKFKIWFEPYRNKTLKVIFFEYDGNESPELKKERRHSLEGAIKCAYKPKYWNT
jgi:predicted GIY-YIG superfamily endonuclease